MKCLIIVTVFCILAVVNAGPTPTSEQKEAVKKAHDHCQTNEETRIDDDVFEKVKKGEKVDNAKLSKHTLCMNVQTGLQTQSGDINVDKLRKALTEAISDPNLVNTIVEKCGKRVAGETAEESAVTFFKCLHSQGPPHGHGHH
uniref:Uncharacterized protein LOC114329530 n=1 Tax=Diabrotica virgifera virgifera TaxID=50390 RepID=A0A6P7FFA6_DIAVI